MITPLTPDEKEFLLYVIYITIGITSISFVINFFLSKSIDIQISRSNESRKKTLFLHIGFLFFLTALFSCILMMFMLFVARELLSLVTYSYVLILSLVISMLIFDIYPSTDTYIRSFYGNLDAKVLLDENIDNNKVMRSYILRSEINQLKKLSRVQYVVALGFGIAGFIIVYHDTTQIKDIADALKSSIYALPIEIFAIYSLSISKSTLNEANKKTNELLNDEAKLKALELATTCDKDNKLAAKLILQMATSDLNKNNQNEESLKDILLEFKDITSALGDAVSKVK